MTAGAWPGGNAGETDTYKLTEHGLERNDVDRDRPGDWPAGAVAVPCHAKLPGLPGTGTPCRRGPVVTHRGRMPGAPTGRKRQLRYNPMQRKLKQRILPTDD